MLAESQLTMETRKIISSFRSLGKDFFGRISCTAEDVWELVLGDL